MKIAKLLMNEEGKSLFGSSGMFISDEPDIMRVTGYKEAECCYVCANFQHHKNAPAEMGVCRKLSGSDISMIVPFQGVCKNFKINAYYRLK